MLSPSVTYIFDSFIKDTLSFISNSTSAMDIQTVFICGGVFVISAAVVYLISAFGMRERTYEEAMEEQRRRNQEAMQHSKNDKSRKEKKFRKWAKRSKEKSEDDKSHACDTDNKIAPDDGDVKGDSGSNSSSQNIDVKISTKKKTRQRKTVLMEKDVIPTQYSKDQAQQLSSSDETDELPSVSSLPDISQTCKENQTPLFADKIICTKEDYKSQSSESPTAHIGEFQDKAEMTDVSRPIKKSPLKKKRNKADLSESGSELIEWNETKVLSVIKMIQLNDEELQRIIDALSSRLKVNEKKKSEFQALKKIIQEKEDALRNEQKSSQAANEKICDLLQELGDTKSQASAVEKSLRTALNQEQQEIKGLHDMMQRKQKHYNDEISALQSKMKKMKSMMKEEHALAIQRLQEENSQLQSMNRMESEKNQRSSMEISRLQHEIDQLRSSREKFESHQSTMQQTQEDLHREIHQLEQIISSHQEDDYNYKQRINELSNKIQQADNARASLVQELQNAQSVCSSLEAENSSLRQRLEELKHQLNSSEQNAIQLQGSLEAKTIEFQEQEAVFKKNENVVHSLMEELEQCNNERDNLLNEVACEKKNNEELSEKNNELNEALQTSQSKMQEVIDSAELKVQEAQIKSDKHSKEMQNLLNEQIKEVELALRESFSKELINAHQETDNIKKQADERVQKVESQANLRLEEFQESLYERLNQLNIETESKVKEVQKEKELITTELKEMNTTLKNLLQSIFPKLVVPENIDTSFLKNCEAELQAYIQDLKEKKPHDSKDLINLGKQLEEKSLEKANLESRIAVYENVLFETESVLKSLQDHIESEEKKWKTDLSFKDQILETIKNENDCLKLENNKLRLSLEQLQDLKESLCEIEDLKLKLHKEEADKKILQEKIQMIDVVAKPSTCPIGENNLLESSESNILPSKSEKRKKSRKRGGSGKK
ncbi:ribosome-binding protein 1 [Parasteatoda tepidariorum]|nr:myosin-J heavy chain [Parasteatoda tepidariorum]XP_042908013.1 myosin-J heavy chain [Parasteatoda tepidariorum]XP_042908014.1 myosin-J heavy chain [Parasteatoda tepidariorum]